MRVYKIFLASSEELASERVAFGNKVQEINDRLLEQKKQVHFTLNKWERDSDSFSNRRKQDDYNNFIENCDIFIMLYWTKVGKYTAEEYDYSYTRLLTMGKPVVFVYQKIARAEVEDSVKAFQEKTLVAHEQFTPRFENANDLGVAFDNELQKLFANGTLEYGVMAKCLYSDGNSAPVQFIGREEELQKIRAKLDEGGQLMLINADGGIGKTSLAAKYWNESLYKYKYNAWLFCENGIVQELKKLAPELHIDLSTLDEAQQLEALKHGLRNASKDFLLVLDNANNPDDIKIFEQHFRGFHWHVLITSRCHNVLGKDKELPITHLPPPLAKELFTSNYKEDNPEFDHLLDRLLAAIGYHTLLIEIFSKNIKTLATYGETMADFLEQLETKGLFLEQRSFKIKTDYSYNVHKSSAETTDAVIEILYDFTKLKEPERLLMVNLALLPAVNYDRLFILSLFKPGNKYGFGGLLDGLVNLGWLSDEQEGYRMSPVVQKLILQKNQDSLKTDTASLLQNLSNILETDGSTLLNISFYKAPAYITLIQTITDNLKNHYSYPLSYINFCCIVYLKGIGDFPACRESIDSYTSICKILNNKNGLAISYQILGDINMQTGDYENALKNYKERQKIGKEIHEAYPESLEAKYDQGVSYDNFGNICYLTRDYTNASINYHEQLKITKEICKANPENVRFKYALAASYTHLGDDYTRKEEYQDALKNYKELIKIAKDIHEASPDNLTFKNLLVISYEKIGDISRKARNYTFALKNYQEQLKFTKEIHETNPENVSFKDKLAISYTNLGISYHKLNEKEKAKTSLNSARAILIALVKAVPEDVEFKKHLNRVEKILADPDDLRFNNLLATNYAIQAYSYEQAGDYQNALKIYQEKFNITKEIHDANPENLEFKNELAISYAKLSHIYEQTGDYTNTLKNGQEYFKIAKDIYEANPENLEFKNDLAASYERLGGIYEQTGDYANALRNYQERQKIAQEIHEDNPENINFKNGLAVSYYMIGGLFQKLNEKEKAKISFVQARAIWVELVKTAPEIVVCKRNLKMVEDILTEM